MRKRPRMFFREPSLSGLDNYLAGYYAVITAHNVEFERVGIWRLHPRSRFEFDVWLVQRIGVGGSNRGFAALILEHQSGDEQAALALFWELLDEYRALESAIDGAVTPEAG